MNAYRVQNVYSKSKYNNLYPGDMIKVGDHHIAPSIESEFSFESPDGDWWYVWLKKGSENPFKKGDSIIGRTILDVYFFQNRKKGCLLLKPL